MKDNESKKTISPCVDWVIHLVANGAACEKCGKTDSGFIPYTCNAHSHGMEAYNHPDFQLVLAYTPKEIMRIINTLGLRVQAGEKFHAGDLITGIYDDCCVRLDEFEESGRTVLRVIVPDKNNLFPEDEKCDELYKLQALPTDALSRGESVC